MTSFEAWLTKVSRVVGLNMHYLMKNGSWITLRFFIMGLTGWLVSLFFARFSDKEVLGQYQLILSYVSLFTFFSLPGLNTAALEAIVNGREGGIKKAVRLSLLFSLVVIPLFMGWGIYEMFYGGKPIIGRTLVMVSFFAPFYYAFNTWTAYYGGKALFKQQSLRLILINIVFSILFIIGIVKKLDVFWLVGIFLTVNTLFYTLYTYEIYKKIGKKSEDDIDMKFGVTTSLQKLVLGLSVNLPPILLAFVFGVEAVAIFYIANYLIQSVSAFIGTMVQLYMPTLFKNLKLNHVSILLKNLLIGILLWLGFIVFLKLFFVLMYGNAYLESLRLAYLISLVMILVPMKNYLLTFFVTQKRNWFLINTVGAANLIAAAILFSLKGVDHLLGVAVYVYAIELFTVVPLVVNNLLRPSLELRKGIKFAK